jgi:LacI family transcriptional regulator
MSTGLAAGARADAPGGDPLRRRVTGTDRAGDAAPADGRRRVALLVETSLAPGREILQGIARYARAHGSWSTFIEPRRLDDAAPDWLATWGGDGIIARVQDRRIADAVRVACVPVVDVLGVVPGLPLVHTDDDRIAALAADHLVERGFRHFAFLGLAGENWSQRRRDAFRRSVAPHARSCALRDTTRVGSGPWDDHVADLSRWLAQLPKPAGLMVCSDQCGPAVLEACRRAAIDVPGQLAVIGVDDDEPLCEATDPGLTSVWPDHGQVGYAAAELLDRLMSGHAAPPAPIFVPPSGVVTRGSTDVLAVDDREVAAAVRIIRDHACDPRGLTIDDVATRVSVSRSALQSRFRRATGRTVHDEILRTRLARAQSLLSGTDLPLAAVAERAGFRHREYLGAVFRKKIGSTPAQYRRAHQQTHID